MVSGIIVQPKTREDYNVTPEMLAPYIGLSRRGYKLDFKIKDLFDMETYIIDHQTSLIIE